MKIAMILGARWLLRPSDRGWQSGRHAHAMAMLQRSRPSNPAVARFAVLLGLVTLGVGVACRAGAPAPQTVIMDAGRYEPAASTVRVGDAITWINKDLVPHTVTSQAGGFDSGAIAPGASWTFTATRVGEFPYTCTFHPTMQAVLHVR